MSRSSAANRSSAAARAAARDTERRRTRVSAGDVERLASRGAAARTTETAVRHRAPRDTAVDSTPRARAGVSHACARLKDTAPFSYHGTWLVMLVLLAVGLCMMLSVSVATAVTPGEDRFAYVRDQGITAVLGLVFLVLVARFDYRRWLRGASMAALAVAFFSLLVVHIPGVSESEGGAASWIPLGPVTFQPSEFAKLALVMAGAHLLTARRSAPGDWRALMLPFGLTGLLMCALVLAEPDLGTAVIIAGLVLGFLWVGGMKGRHFALLTGTGVGLAAVLVLLDEEKKSRFLSFLHPGADPYGSGFQLSQSLVALGRGGWFGVGPGESVQKFSYLPKAHTDMIFAILGEEFGLLGAGVVIVLFAAFAMAAWRLARQCADPMGRYLLAGCGMLVTLQAVINIGGVIGAMPLTGVPLPFVSFGRNSLLVMLIAVGLMLSVARWAPGRSAPASSKGNANVAHLDSGWRDGGPRGARAGAR